MRRLTSLSRLGWTVGITAVSVWLVVMTTEITNIGKEACITFAISSSLDEYIEWLSLHCKHNGVVILSYDVVIAV